MTAQSRAVAAVAVSALLAFAYALSLTFAQATPEPHEVPVALVGFGPDAVQGAERAAGGSFDVRAVPDGGRARGLLRDREVDGALVAPAEGRAARLLTAPAGGVALATVIEERLPKAAGLQGEPQVEQVRPLRGQDGEGRALDFLVFPLVIFGLLGPLLLTTVAPQLPVRRRLLGAALLAALGGTAPSWPPASCSSVPHELLPGAYRELGPWLPPGAAADALRGLSYFDGAGAARGVLVLCAYAVTAVGIDAALGHRRPAAAGTPSGPTPDASR